MLLSLRKNGKLGFSRLLSRSRPPFTGVPRGPDLKVPHGVLFEQLWAPASECPKECFLSAFRHFLAPKNAENNSKSTLWGTPRQVPKVAQKALRRALSLNRAPGHSCKWRPGSQPCCSICDPVSCHTPCRHQNQMRHPLPCRAALLR